MRFNELAEEILWPLFREYGFVIAETYKNYIKFCSEKIEVIISHNEYENSNALYIYGINKTGGLIGVDEINYLFDGKAHVHFSPMAVFMTDILFFFENDARSLLIGDAQIIVRADDYIRHKSKVYTEKILHEQNLHQAEIAWEARNYRKFIEIMQKIERDQWADAYRLKYEIALKRL